MKKHEIWAIFKRLRNGLDAVPPQFQAIKWRTPRADMEQALDDLERYVNQGEREFEAIDLKDDGQVIDIELLDPEYLPEVKRVLANLGDAKDTKYLVRFQYVDGDETDGKVFNSTGLVMHHLRYMGSKYYDEEVEVERIFIERIVPEPEPVVPPMAFSAESINCVVKQCFEQSHKKTLLKEKPGMFMTIEDIKQLEEKFKINVYITDSFNELWRKPDVIYPKKSSHYPTDVFIRCHNFHATRAFRVKDFAVPKKEKLNPNMLISNFHISKAPDKLKYLTPREMMNYHIDLLKTGKIHHVIDTGSKVIGIIKDETHYKEEALKNYPFLDPSDWSLSGYARRVFKQSILEAKKPEQQFQISDSTVYENIQKSQAPITVIFQQKAKGNIIQIDQTQAYKNASIGNIGETKKYYEGYPCAPRNVININEAVSVQLLERLSALGLGFALISFDQTEHMNSNYIPLLHTGKAHPTGDTVISLPALKYYSTFDKVKIYVKQYYYSKFVHYPFDKSVATFDQLVEDAKDANIDYGEIRQIPNLLIGGLNKRHHRCKVFSTSSMAEAKRFLSDDTKIINRFKTIDRFEDRIQFLDDVDDSKVTLLKEYIFYYQEKGEAVLESFNMTHLSKYVLDYQKIAIHNKVREVCNDDIKNLICINTDSICYISGEDRVARGHAAAGSKDLSPLCQDRRSWHRGDVET